MILNGPEFRRKLTKAEEEAGELSLRFQKRIALEAMRRVVARTPVDTGRARGGWQMARGQGTNADTGSRDAVGSATVGTALSILDRIRIPFGLITVFNNVEYITFLEEGSSDQAPLGMVAVTLIELEAIASAAGFSKQFQFSAEVNAP